MAHLLESFERFAWDALGGGVGRAQIRVRVFQVDEFAEECVVFAIGDLRRGLLVIETIVARDFAP
jgi:hypothetical protein